MLVVFPMVLLDRPVGPFTQQSLQYQGVPREALLRAHLCRRGLHWVYWKRSHAAINTPETERLCTALSLFFMRQGRRCVWSLYCHNPSTKTTHSSNTNLSFLIPVILHWKEIASKINIKMYQPV